MCSSRTAPAATPTLTLSVTPSASSAECIFSWICMPHWAARRVSAPSASPSSTSGHSTIIASPANFITSPPFRLMMRTSCEKYELR